MTVLQSLLIISPFVYSIIVSIVLSMLIGYKKYKINSKNFYIMILCYLPIIILAIIIAFFVPNSTTDGSLVVVKVLEFILPFIWAFCPIYIQKSNEREEQMQQLMDKIEQYESKNKNE